MLDKPICSKTGDVGEGNSLRWAVASMQGWRCEMEDTHAVRSGLHNKPPIDDAAEQLETVANNVATQPAVAAADGASETDSTTATNDAAVDPPASQNAEDHPNNGTATTAKPDVCPESSITAKTSTPSTTSATVAATVGTDHSQTAAGQFADWSFFAVFDGHAGERSAVYSSQHLLDAILETDAFQQNRYVEGIRTGFLSMDDALRASSSNATNTIQPDSSGSTAIAAFVSPQHVYLANCGDSRAILCRDNAPEFATRDHKPVLSGERDRILKAGGSVIIQRVNGSLAVSRALGDFEYKNVLGFGQCEQLVSPEPEVFCVDRDLKMDQFMVLACDGIWDVMSNEEICRFVGSRLRVTNDLRTITNAVIDTCFHKVNWVFGCIFVHRYI